MTDLVVLAVPALSDNYIWLVHDPASGETAVVDPGEAAPALAAAAERGWTIGQVWVTHWHPDHTAGIAAIKAQTGATVTGPAAEAAKIPTLDLLVAEGDTLHLGDHVAQVWETPGHTAGHITLLLKGDALAFTGDTLFAMGCGRLFEGTPEQMFANMQRLSTLPDETLVYGAHEYTQSNGRFASTVEPGNEAVRRRMVEVDALRARGEPTLPTTIGAERATNPFVRAGTAEEFAARRRAKDAA
ncbi:hydroxyacylglutathione hydrolase [Sphingomonas aracearum]|uniref:hydroxyacylglutathione hydrolase n=1 Tax=Sphingomonas aracearum TaxID=2283317 RepID=UPI001EF13DE9|nr:hydroxyacylglutathione hydrolase [Sphingomonas aracearum]